MKKFSTCFLGRLRAVEGCRHGLVIAALTFDEARVWHSNDNSEEHVSIFKIAVSRASDKAAKQSVLLGCHEAIKDKSSLARSSFARRVAVYPRQCR